MAVLGKVVWFTGDWVGFSLPNVMVIEEAKGKSMMGTYKTRRSQEADPRPAEPGYHFFSFCSADGPRSSREFRGDGQ